MTFEQFQRYQEQAFDAYFKKAVRNESINAHKEIMDRAEKEIPFSSLSQEELHSIATVDIYRPYCKKFFVRGNTIRVYDPILGDLLLHLSPQRREILLLGYFLGLNDYEIGRLLHIDHKTVDYRRTVALRRLKELIGDEDYG